MQVETLAELRARVLELIKAKVNRPMDEANLEATFETLGFESMDAFDVLFAVEEEFHLNIADEDARQLDSVQKLLDYLARELKL